MNKSELVTAIADKLADNTTRKQIDATVSAAIDVIIEAVANGDKVTIVGFGSFEPRDRKERQGRNPKTGSEMIVPAAKVPAFSAGKLFREQVKNG